jgi:pimeloyl-ACP methyl ester carboxylesterase
VTTAQAKDRPTVVLVHGGFLGPWIWADVVAELGAHGVESKAVDLPSVSEEGPRGDFTADAQAVRAVLDRLTAPVVLCGHSYAGAVITEAAAGPHPVVQHLVYLAAAAPDTGDTLLSLSGHRGGRADASEEEQRPPAEPVMPQDDGSILLTPDGARAGLFHDCDPIRAQEAIARLRPMNPAVSTQATTGVAWRQVPATYVRCTQDRVPELLAPGFLEHGVRLVELPTGHCPQWSRPDLVAGLLVSVCEECVSGP